MSEADRARAAAARRAARARMEAQQTPDGRQTAPGTTQDQAARIPEGMVYDERRGQYVDTKLSAERQGPVQGAIINYLAGTPFVGEFVDEAMGQALGAFGRSPEVEQEITRQTREQFREDRPGMATALEVGGGIVGSLPIAASSVGRAADAFVRGGTKVGNVLRAGAVGAGFGVAEGAAQGAGRAEEGDRAQGAAQGAAIGGTLGGALGAFAPLVGQGVEELARRVKRLDVRAIADEFGISPPAARTVKEALLNDDLDEAAKRLSQLGDDAMLADAGPATQGLLDAAVTTGGEALTTTRRAVEGRAQTVGSRLRGKLDDILGKPMGVRAAAREISDSTRAARSSAYQRAYAQPINYADDAGRSIEAVLERVPSGTLRRAIDEANESMQEAGLRNMQIMAEVADDGAVVFREMPNVQQLDQIKRALDSIAREAVDQFGRPTAQGQRASRLARDLRNALGDAAPAYRAALREGADKVQRDLGLDLGRKLLWGNTSVEDVLDFVRNRPSGEAMAAARQGVRETIENTMSKVRRTITDPNVDAREAMQIVKQLSSRQNMAKLRLILGKQRAEELLSELDKQATSLLLRGAVSRNSQTAVRQSIQRQVVDEAQPGVIRRTAGNLGNPLEAAREITQDVAGIDPRSLNARQREVFAEIARALTDIRGADAQRALQSVNKALQGQPLRDAEAQAIARVWTIPGFTAAYQAGQQSLAPQ